VITNPVTFTAIAAPGATLRYAYTPTDSDDPTSLFAATYTGESVIDNGYVWIEVTSESTTIKQIYKIRVSVQTLIGSVSILGNLYVGETLEATLTGPAATDPLYQWQQDYRGDGAFKDIIGENASTYLLTTANRGNQIKIIVTRVDYSGMLSATTGKVLNNLAGVSSYNLAGVTTGTLGRPASNPFLSWTSLYDDATIVAGEVTLTEPQAAYPVAFTAITPTAALGATLRYAYTGARVAPTFNATYSGTAVRNNDYVWIEVTAEDGRTTLIYKIKVTVLP
jgi:hypothetical protein